MLISLWSLPHVSTLTNPCLLFLLPFTVGLVLAGEMKFLKVWEQALMIALVCGFCWIAEPTSRPYLVTGGKLLWPLVGTLGICAAVWYAILFILHIGAGLARSLEGRSGK